MLRAKNLVWALASLASLASLVACDGLDPAIDAGLPADSRVDRGGADLGDTLVTNRPPSLHDLRIVGTVAQGERVQVAYDFEDPDGDEEGPTVCRWTEGERELHRGHSFDLPVDTIGRPLTVTCLPVDLHGLEGARQAIDGGVVSGERPLRLPACDPANPEVVMIASNADWQQINDAHSIFCVSPGDYSALGPIGIFASGTREHPRYLLLNNGNDEHPASLERSMLAQYRILLRNADYWVIDRQSYWEDEDPSHDLVDAYNANHNVFNRAFFVDTAAVIQIHNGSHANTIQHAHMEKTEWSVDFALAHPAVLPATLPPYPLRIWADLAAILLVGDEPGVAIRETVVVNNEIINYADAFQTLRIGGASRPADQPNPPLDGAATVIIGNVFYSTPLVYTDGEGHFTPAGHDAVTENALDFKFGSLDPERPMRVLQNTMFGYRHVDNHFSSLGDNGNAVVFHFGAGHILLEDNQFLDCNNGFAAGGPRGEDPPFYHVTLRRNVFYGMLENTNHIYGTVGDESYDGSDHIRLERNVFGSVGLDTISDHPASFHAYNSRNITLFSNYYVETLPMYFAASHSVFRSEGLTIEQNVFYGTPMTGIPDFATASGNTQVETSFDWEPWRRTVVLRRFTNLPESVRLPAIE